VPTPDRRYELRNEELKKEARDLSPVPLHFCGRLANYTYINQDRAIEQGLTCARAVAAHLTQDPPPDRRPLDRSTP